MLHTQPSLTRIEPTVFLARMEGKLWQLVHVHITHVGDPVVATLLVDNNHRTREVSLGSLATGDTVHDVFVDEVTAPAEIIFALKLDGVVVSQQAVSWRPPRHWVVHVVQTSHHDLGYTDLASNVLHVHDRWLDDAIDMAQQAAQFPQDARFRMVIEQAWSLAHFLRHAPVERARSMIDLLRCGQFELNALYGNMTSELCGHEEMIRCLYPAFRLKREYGIPLVSAEHNDIPGISWGLCQALTDAGIRFFAPGLPLYYHWGNLGLASFWDQSAIFAHDGPGAFWWEAPSGKRLLFWCNNTGCGGDAHPHLPGLAETLQRLDGIGYPHGVIRWPVNGAARDNSPYTFAFAETIRAWNERWVFPRLICSTNAMFYTDFVEHLSVDPGRQQGVDAGDNGIRLPVFRGDLPGQDYPVGATSTAAATAVNRNNHAALPAAETLAALASVMSDYVYQAGPLAEAYEETLTHDEHTWGHHFPAGPAAHTAQLEKAVHAYRGGALAHDVLNKAMARIADHVRAEGTGFPLVVFNLTGTNRTDIVRTPLRELDNCGSTIVTVPPEEDAQGAGYLRGVLLHDRWHFNLPPDVIHGAFDLVDAVTGASVPYQLISIEADAPVPYAAERAGLGAGTRRYGFFELPVGLKKDLCFVAADVPAYGYRTYRLVPNVKPSQPKRGVKGLATTLENAFYRIVVNRRNGAIVSILDKELGHELVDDRCQHPFNTLVVRDPFGAEWEMMRARVHRGVSGPICSSVEVTATAHGHPVVQQSITLYAGIKRIELATRILKDATPLLDVHLAFPFNVVHPGFRYESVLAAVEPERDYLPGSQWDRVAVQNWVKVSADDFTIMWSSLDAPVVSLGRLWPGYVSPAHRCVVTEDVKQHRRLTSADLQRGWIYSDICYNNLGTNFSVSQSGDMLFRYAVTSRSGAASDGAAADFGWQAVTPLSTILARPLPQAHLPVSDRLLRLQGEHVVLLALKQAEDSRGYIARLWNMGDHATTAQIQLCGMAVRKAVRTNAVEEDLEVLVLDAEHEVQVPIGAHALSSVRLLLN